MLARLYLQTLLKTQIPSSFEFSITRQCRHKCHNPILLSLLFKNASSATSIKLSPIEISAGIPRAVGDGEASEPGSSESRSNARGCHAHATEECLSLLKSPRVCSDGSGEASSALPLVSLGAWILSGCSNFKIWILPLHVLISHYISLSLSLSL